MSTKISAEMQLHNVPISSRPPLSSHTLPKAGKLLLHQLGFNIFFFLTCTIIHLFQLVVLPIRLLDGVRYRALIRWTKECFSSLLSVVTWIFGRTDIHIWRDGDGMSKHSAQDLGWDRYSINICNHQDYADWIYLWVLLKSASVSSGICIILKESLEHVPILGWAMQMFNFIFIGKHKLLQQPLNSTFGLPQVTRQAVKDSAPFSLLLFPEGTLVSRLTRPKSAAFSKQLNQPDLEYALLPRAKGLHYSLQTYLQIIPGQKFTVYDITMAYPLPWYGSSASSSIEDREKSETPVYAQDYYTLQSVYGRGVAPPQMGILIESINIRDIPGLRFRDSSTKSSDLDLDEKSQASIQKDEDDFNEWIYKRWRLKDERLAHYAKYGVFSNDIRHATESRTSLEYKPTTEDWTRLGLVSIGSILGAWGWYYVLGAVYHFLA